VQSAVAWRRSQCAPFRKSASFCHDPGQTGLTRPRRQWRDSTPAHFANASLFNGEPSLAGCRPLTRFCSILIPSRRSSQDPWTPRVRDTHMTTRMPTSCVIGSMKPRSKGWEARRGLGTVLARASRGRGGGGEKREFSGWSRSEVGCPLHEFVDAPRIGRLLIALQQIACFARAIGAGFRPSRSRLSPCFPSFGISPCRSLGELANGIGCCLGCLSLSCAER
jgi:hypothetical protein